MTNLLFGLFEFSSFYRGVWVVLTPQAERVKVIRRARKTPNFRIPNIMHHFYVWCFVFFLYLNLQSISSISFPLTAAEMASLE